LESNTLSKKDSSLWSLFISSQFIYSINS